MLETIGKLFNPSKITDAIIDTGDMLVFTDEEKAKMKLDLLKHYEPFKLAQRLLSLIFAINFIIAFWVGVALFIWFPNLASGYIGLVKAYQLGWIMLAIVSFYFTGGVINTFKGKQNEK